MYWMKGPPRRRPDDADGFSVAGSADASCLLLGAQWRHHHQVIAQLPKFYSRLPGSPYDAVVSQYNRADNDPRLGGINQTVTKSSGGDGHDYAD